MTDEIDRVLLRSEVLSEIAEVAGVPAALAISAAFGGQRLYIPPVAKDDHPLVKCVGRVAADAICDYYKLHDHNAKPIGDTISLPMGFSGAQAERWRSLKDMIIDGKTNREIISKLGVNRDTVRRHRKKLLGTTTDPNQILFPFMGGG